MDYLPIPSLLIVNSATYQHYLPKLDKDEKIPSPQKILELLDQVKNNSAPVITVYMKFYNFFRLILWSSQDFILALNFS